MAVIEASEKDFDRLVEFWNENSGWDIITRAIWEKRFVNAPHAPSVILFIEKQKSILAMLVFVRSKICIGHKLIEGCRPFAAITEKSVRGISGIKYIVQLMHSGYKNLRKKGVDLLIALPDPRWKPFMRLMNVHWGEFPLYKMDLYDHIESIERNGNEVKNIDFEYPQIKKMWDKIKTKNIYMVLRDPANLKWKNSHRDYKLVGIFSGEELTGVVTYLEKFREKQIQICDVLIPDEQEQKNVFIRLSIFLNQEYFNNPDFKKMVVLVPKMYEKSLSAAGFIPDDYQFLFAFKLLNKNISKKALNISNWYLSAND